MHVVDCLELTSNATEWAKLSRVFAHSFVAPKQVEEAGTFLLAFQDMAEQQR